MCKTLKQQITMKYNCILIINYICQIIQFNLQECKSKNATYKGVTVSSKRITLETFKEKYENINRIV